MKKILFLITATILLFNSCEKVIDENGYHITYYKNKTAEGYVFYYNKFDSIWPAKNNFVTIESVYCSGGLFGGVCKEHKDIVFTDKFGKYSFDIVKTINGKNPTGYFINLGSGSPKLSTEDVRKQNIIQLETYYIYIHY